MTLLEELEEFVDLHRAHGVLTPDAGAPSQNGYMLTVACPCGVAFMRWITPHDAALDLALLHRLSGNQVASLVQQGRSVYYGPAWGPTLPTLVHGRMGIQYGRFVDREWQPDPSGRRRKYR